MSRRGKSIEMESRLVIARGWGRGNGMQSDCLKGLSFIFRVMEMFWN